MFHQIMLLQQIHSRPRIGFAVWLDVLKLNDHWPIKHQEHFLSVKPRLLLAVSGELQKIEFPVLKNFSVCLLCRRAIKWNIIEYENWILVDFLFQIKFDFKIWLNLFLIIGHKLMDYGKNFLDFQPSKMEPLFVFSNYGL